MSARSLESRSSWVMPRSIHLGIGGRSWSSGKCVASRSE